MPYEFKVSTRGRCEMTDVTSQVRKAIRELKVEDGAVLVVVPHTTAGVTIQENADPDVVRDMLKELEKIVPFEDGYRHIEGNAAAHIKTSLLGSSVTLVVEGGEPAFGTWQGVYFCEFDGPRTRKVWVKPLG
jgi:secondary thiamine-phosphate synthase enzyme